VKCLAGEHAVDGRVGKRDRLRAPGQALGGGHDLFEDPAHAVQRLDRDDPAVAAREHAGELARPGTEVEHLRVGAERQPVERRRRSMA